VIFRQRLLIRQTGADLAQRPDHVCNGAHPAIELAIEPAHKKKSLDAVGISQEAHNIWHVGLRSSYEGTEKPDLTQSLTPAQNTSAISAFFARLTPPGAGSICKLS
jgi:hypothetical protein